MKNKIFKYIVIILIIIVSIYTGINFYNKEKAQYELYEEFSMASEIMALSYNKDVDIFYSVLRLAETKNTETKDTIISLLLDLKEYDFIPSLNYLIELNDSDSYDGIITLLLFLKRYNSATINKREDIFNKEDTDLGHNYKYTDGVFKFKVTKKVLNKEFYNDNYEKYLKKEGYSNFLDKLSKLLSKKLNKSYNNIKFSIKNNYDEFYSENKDIINDIVLSDFNDFSNYLYDTYICKEEGFLAYLKVKIDDKYIDEISINYNYTKGERIYTNVIRYYKYSYNLDVNYLWEQMDELNYPRIYC